MKQEKSVTPMRADGLFLFHFLQSHQVLPASDYPTDIQFMQSLDGLSVILEVDVVVII